MNTNTNGSKVTNIGFWPRGILAKIADIVVDIGNSLKGLLDDGTQLPGTVDFSEKQGSDKLGNDTMEEIARRLIVTVEKEQIGNVLFQPTPPDDHTKAWVPTDPVSGLPTDGKIRVWDSNTSAWVLADNQPGYVAPLKRFVAKHIAAGTSTVNFEFPSIGTINYFPTVTFTTQNADNTWAAPPGSYPAGFGYLITNKTETSVSIAFFAVPAGGMNCELQCEQKP